MSRPVFMGVWRDPATEPPPGGTCVLFVKKETPTRVRAGLYRRGVFAAGEPVEFAPGVIAVWTPLPVYKPDATTEDDLRKAMRLLRIGVGGATDEVGALIDRLRALLEEGES